MKRKVAVVVLLLLASFWSGWTLNDRKKNDRPIELAKAFPVWNEGECVPPEPEELARYEVAIEALDPISSHGDALSLGAMRFLAYSMYRRDGDQSFRVCPPEGFYEAVADIMAKHDMWRPRQTEYGLRLASQIGEDRPEIVAAVAAVAFSEYPQIGSFYPRDDLRPFARTVLAGLGPGNSPYGQIAYDQMSSENSLGTGAAQVAAAAGHPDALPKIQSMMFGLLRAGFGTIPAPRRDRLYELAYAIYFSGDEAKEYLRPLLLLMRRKVWVYVPSFYWIETSPKPMCAVLRRISPDDTELIQQFPYCNET